MTSFVIHQVATMTWGHGTVLVRDEVGNEEGLTPNGAEIPLRAVFLFLF